MAKYKYKVTNKAGGSCFVPPHSKFYLDYKQGKRVKAKNGTLGVMVFSTKPQATKFMESYGFRLGQHVKRVIPVGKVTFPAKVSVCPKDIIALDAFNKMSQKERVYDSRSIAPLLGTECYPEVIVVD